MHARPLTRLPIRRIGVLVALLLLATAASLGAQTLTFIDDAGLPAATYLEGSRFDLRLDDPSSNSNPTLVEFASVQVVAAISGELVYVDCFETGPNTGIFEGGMRLGTMAAPPPYPALRTAVDPGPPAQRDTLQANWNGATANAGLIGSAVRWTAADGTPVTAYALGQTLHLEIEDHLFGSEGFVDSLFTSARAVAGGDEESLSLIETGPSTNVYRTTLPSRTGPAFSFDGELTAFDGDALRAVHPDSDGVAVQQVDADAAASLTFFIDADGRPTDQLLAGGQGRLRVIDFDAAGTAQVDLSAQLTGDSESIFLDETGGDTGIFEGFFTIAFDTFANAFDGILQTGEDPGPPHGGYDVVDARYFDSGNSSSAQATTRVSIVTLRDPADDSVRAVFVPGDVLRIHVEAPAAGVPGFVDSIPVELTSSGAGDVENVALDETGPDTGIFTADLPVVDQGFANSNDDQLQVFSGDTIEAIYVEPSGATDSRAQATVAAARLSFLDADGSTVDTVLEDGTLFIRLVSGADNGDPASAQLVSIQLDSRYGGDQEFVTAVETGPDTSVFEGSIPLTSFGSTPQDGTLGTQGLGPGSTEPDTVTALYNDAFATATTVHARIAFLDADGAVTDRYPEGAQAIVRVEDATRNSPGVTDVFDVEVRVDEAGSLELLTLTETGPDTGVFTGSIEIGCCGVNGPAISGSIGQTVAVRHADINGVRSVEATAQIVDAVILFIDASGAPATFVLEGSRVFVRLIKPNDNSDPTTVQDTFVDLTSALGSDIESIQVRETGVDTGVFEGEIALDSGPPNNFDGQLQTQRDPGPPARFDTITATHDSGSQDAVSAQITTRASRTIFIDELGQPTDSYPQGGRVFVRVEDHNLDSPGIVDTLTVELIAEVFGDLEPLTLQETGSDTAIFEGWIQLVDGPSGFADGLLSASEGETIRAIYSDTFGTSTSDDSALIRFGAVFFLDANGDITTEILQDDLVRLRAISNTDNVDPGTADPTQIELRSLFTGDTETVDLFETGPDTGVFEGAIPMDSFGFSPFDGIITSQNFGPPLFTPDTLTAQLGPGGPAGAVTTAATVRSGSVRFVDAAGNDAATFVFRAPLTVEVRDNVRNDPGIVDGFDVELIGVETGDLELLSVTETGFDTGIFTGSMLIDAGGSGDGKIWADPGQQIEVRTTSADGVDTRTDRAHVGEAQIRFVDAIGNDVDVVL
ncbi:MAG: hypothetical protein AAF772_16245, partial [Acidobacteriota bacterium]